MSEENKIVKTKRIKRDAEVQFKIGTAFYERLKELLYYHFSQKSEEEITKILEAFATRRAENEFEYHAETLIALVSQIESKGFEQGLIEDHEIDISKFT